jgi:threonine aldolase
MLNGKIDLRSDTITQPTPAMREAMAAAEVGDDVFEDDPTVNRLQQYAASLFGKEAALLVPSGTMGNLLAAMTLARPGDTILFSHLAHPFHHETGNTAMIAGLQTGTIETPTGLLTADQVQARFVLMDDVHLSHTTLVSIENTANLAGGAVYPVETVADISRVCREAGVKLHMDGARVFNACVASGVPPSDYGQHVDSLTFCLSKGLGCPVGSVFVGDRATITAARRYRKALGGGMRQAGILAAAGLYALEHHIERLADDHRRAARFREALEGTDGIHFYMPSPTNLVYMEVPDAFAFVGQLAALDVMCLPETATHVRAAFNLHVTDEDVEKAIEAFKAIAAELSGATAK